MCPSARSLRQMQPQRQRRRRLAAAAAAPVTSSPQSPSPGQAQRDPNGAAKNSRPLGPTDYVVIGSGIGGEALLLCLPLIRAAASHPRLSALQASAAPRCWRATATQ